MNAYLEEFPADKEDQETAPLPADEIMDILFHSMPTTWKKKMIEQGFNYADSTIKEITDFFETRVETWSLRKIRKIFCRCQDVHEIPQEKEKGRLRLQCRRVQRGINQSSPYKQEILCSKWLMQPFYGQLQRSMCYFQQAQMYETKEFQELRKEQQRAKCSN